MGRSFENDAKEVALKKEDQVYGQRLAEMAKRHASEVFYYLDDPLEAAVFSVMVEMMRADGRKRIQNGLYATPLRLNHLFT